MSRYGPTMPHPLDQIATLAATAREEAARMLAAAQGHDGHVRIPAEQFRHLAHLLAALGRAAGACGGSECLGAPVDGVRLWMTRDASERLGGHVQSRTAGDLTL